uniref:Uncharacterized protein n=1 Tax=Panagrolaimus superbus TaxID=310955 RepID=A0A914Y4J0_9BILA
MDNAIRVSIAELLEVRSDGLYTPELLSIIVGACEHLRRIDKSGVFNTDYIFFAPNGKIEITLVSAAHIAEESLPPELRDHIDEDDRLGVREPQMVWCLGDVIRQSCAQACSDAELFSLLNLMTVNHVGTRPTLAKLGQMTKNRCAAAGIDVNGVLKALYEELMGDIDELVDDATSLSGWSEVNGHGPKDQKQQQLINNHESPPSTSHSDEDIEDDDDDGNDTDDAIASSGYRTYLPPVQEEENNYKQATKVVRRDSDESSMMTLSSDEKDESRKASISSAATLKSASESSSEDGEKTPKRRSPSPEYERAITPIAEESETPSPHYSSISESPFLIAQKLHQQEKETVLIQKESKSTELPQSPFVTEMTQNPFMSVKKASTSPPSPRNILPSKISEEESDLDETDLPPPRHNLPPSPKFIPKTTPNTGAGVVSARKKSSIVSSTTATSTEQQQLQQPPTPISKGIPETLPVQVQPRQQLPSEEGNLSRHNSLGPSKVHRRSSRGGKAGASAFATPEFVEKQTLAVIRLQAQSSRKKRLSLHRIEPTFVLVKIVNGQTVEVNCKSDAFVGSVFDSVVEYFNVPEHTFFGLSVIRDNEYFFLDNEQRLEKYAPPGWKSAKKGNQEKYMLYLRFRYYPKKLEFIKTPTTTHSLYLQLRQDILHDSLKPKRDKLFELAALSLQAEFGDSKMPKMGAKVPYFKLQHYLPPRAYIDQDGAKVENNLIEIHSHYSGQASILSERQFIELCQSETDYGAHYYRVYKFKPSATSINTNQMNDIFKIAILPDGLGICTSEGSTPAYTVINQFHPWHMIRTLQFDRKRFLIATIENGIAQDHVFYTDHYTKSGYLVKFAASQHKFMLKMRHWQFTLSRERPGGKDVGYERSSIEASGEDESKEIVFATMPKRTIPEKQPPKGISESRSEETPRRGTNQTTTPTPTSIIQPIVHKNPFEEVESEGEENEPQRIQLKIILEKDPSTGLGLTLVDGAVEDIKGVYVKSVSSDGDAKRKGIEKGDCIQAINGISLVDKTRHDAVELVKQSGREVELDIMRFPCITQILGHERQTSKDEILGTNGFGTTSTPNNNGGFRKLPPTKNELLVEKRPSVSRTPPANRKVTPTSKNVRQRAASDFGAIGDALPVLKSEDLLAGFEKARRRTRSNSGSDNESDGGEAHRGEYRLPVTSIYNFHASEDEDEDAGKPTNSHGNGSTNYPLDDETQSWMSKSTLESTAQKSVQSYPQRQNLDWTNELSDIEDSPDNLGSDMQRLQISIHRLGTKTLGFQVASGGGFVSVKAVTSDPAVSAGVKVDDRIIAVNFWPKIHV